MPTSLSQDILTNMCISTKKLKNRCNIRPRRNGFIGWGHGSTRVLAWEADDGRSAGVHGTVVTGSGRKALRNQDDLQQLGLGREDEDRNPAGRVRVDVIDGDIGGGGRVTILLVGIYLRDWKTVKARRRIEAQSAPTGLLARQLTSWPLLERRSVCRPIDT